MSMSHRDRGGFEPGGRGVVVVDKCRRTVTYYLNVPFGVLCRPKYVSTYRQFHQRSTYSFYARRSRNEQKRQSSQQCCLALLGPTGVKAIRRTLMKLTPNLFVHTKSGHSFDEFWLKEKKMFSLKNVQVKNT